MQRHTRDEGREGFAIVAVLICLVFLLGLAAAATVMSNVVLDTSSQGSSSMNSFYAADSGAQSAHARLCAADGELDDVSYAESLGANSAQVAIRNLGSKLFEIESRGHAGDKDTTVFMHIQFTEIFDIEGALQIEFEPGVQVTAPALEIELNASTSISGEDHDATGALIADQSEATFGVAMTPVPGGVGTDVYVDVANGADLVGVPSDTTNTATGQSEVWNNLVAYARDNADVTVVGGTLWNNSDINDIGTAADPKLVYVDLGDNHTVDMRQNFIGYGTLVIDAGNITTEAALKMQDSTEWQGLVVLHLSGQAEVPGEELVRIWNHAHIIGGLVVHYAGDAVTVTGSGQVLEATTGNASIIYSSTLVKNAIGISEVIDASGRIISYRVD